MSIDCGAFCGYGWIFSAEERDDIVIKTIEAYEEIEDIFYRINCYVQDGEYFLGTKICGVDAGYAETISLKDFLNATIEIHDFFKYLVAAGYDDLWLRENPPSYQICCCVT